MRCVELSDERTVQLVASSSASIAANYSQVEFSNRCVNASGESQSIFSAAIRISVDALECVSFPIEVEISDAVRPLPCVICFTLFRFVFINCQRFKDKRGQRLAHLATLCRLGLTKPRLLPPTRAQSTTPWVSHRRLGPASPCVIHYNGVNNRFVLLIWQPCIPLRPLIDKPRLPGCIRVYVAAADPMSTVKHEFVNATAMLHQATPRVVWTTPLLPSPVPEIVNNNKINER